MTSPAAPARSDRLLFAGCFLALIATAFGFIVRAMLMNTWQAEFGLTETQKGEIFGVGLWPFAISIVLFSLVIDRIGYGVAMVFAFVCHVASAVITVNATGYWGLWTGSFICALGNGTVEAVINPVVATMFSREKTKWLNILHAGWPGGLVLGGLLAIGMSDGGMLADAFGTTDWRTKVWLLLIPTVLYGLLLLGRRFPVQERVAAGVSDRDMLAVPGALGMFVVFALVGMELARVFAFSTTLALAGAAVAAFAFGAYSRSPGRLLFVLLLLLMIPLATTELGVDSWITPLMEGEMKKEQLNPVWVLIYTSFIMMVLRLFAGAIVHRLSPLALLATCSALAALGLWWLSSATGTVIFIAATIYAVGKTFFWPTMLGVVSERFPQGGALAINATGGVGMLGVGVVGAVFLGYFQDTEAVRQLQQSKPAVYQQVVTEKTWVFGSYTAIDPTKQETLDPATRGEVKAIQDGAQKGALRTAAVFPLVMLACYVLIGLWFKTRGGYRAEQIGAGPSH
jgi:MFS family permease